MFTAKAYSTRKSWQNISLISLYVFFLFARAPDILLQGRFWAEEGFVFYSNAFNLHPLQALFHVYGGYINLGASGTTLIARYVFLPPRYAPYVTIFCGLFVQLLPLYVLLTAKDKWLQLFKTRVLATLLLLFIPESSEISLQCLHLQFHLTLACVFIAFTTSSYNHQKPKLFILFLAPLCGLLPITTIPIFLYKTITKGNRAQYYQMLALIGGSSIQLSFYLTNHWLHFDTSESWLPRYNHLSYTELTNVIFVRDILFPFLGHRNVYALKWMANISSALQYHSFSRLACVIPTLLFLGLIALFLKYPKTRAGLNLLFAAIFIQSICIYGSIGGPLQVINPYFTERYSFIAQAILAFLLLYFSITLPFKGSIVCHLLIGWLLIVGINNFFYTFPETKDGAGKIWSQELKKWKKNTSYHPKTWSSGWYIVMPKALVTNRKLP